MAKWVAGWNTPGYLPWNEPDEFETWTDARDYLVAELDRETQLDVNDGDDRAASDFAHAADTLRAQPEGVPVTVNAAGVAYWIEEGDADA